jgi:hypothetical protein
MDNLHFTFDLEYNICDIVGWYDRNSFDGKHFVVGPVYGSSHAETVEVWLVPQLRDRGITEDAWLQDEGATEHFVITR